MFDGEIVRKKFPFKKILDLENFWSKTESKTKSKTESKIKSKTESKTRSKTESKTQSKTESKTEPKTKSKTESKTKKLDLNNFHKIFVLQKALKCHVWWRNCEKKNVPFKKILD